MGTTWIPTLMVSALALGCSKQDRDAGGGGTIPGTLAPRALTSKDGALTVKGPMPAAWKPEDVPQGVKLTQLGDNGVNQGHVEITLEYADASAESLAKDTTASDEAYGPNSLVAKPAEIAPGRWGRVHQHVGIQWRPGIDMFDATVFWAVGDRRVARCWVRWLGKSADGALDLCKALEATVTP